MTFLLFHYTLIIIIIISWLSFLPHAVSFIQSSSKPSSASARAGTEFPDWNRPHAHVDQYFQNNLVDTRISLDDFDQYLYSIRVQYSAIYDLIPNDSHSFSVRTRYYSQYFLNLNDRRSHSSYLKYYDFFNLLLFKSIFDECVRDPAGPFIDYLKVLINHIPDLKVTCYRDNFSVLSLLAHDKKIFKLFRDRLDRLELEYNAYFEPLKSVFRTAGDSEADSINLDLKPYLLSLALFTPQIQLNVIRECMSICSNSKKLLLHLTLIYRLDEQVFDYLVMDLGANLNNLIEKSYTFSKITGFLGYYAILDNFDSIPSFIFSNSSAKYKIPSRLFYLIPESTTRHMIEPLKELSTTNNEENFVYGMRESKISTRNATSFTSAFYHFSERIVDRLIEMAPSKQMKNDLKYHFYHLIISSNSQKYSPGSFTFDKDDLQYDRFITRFSQGFSDIITIALLSKYPETLGWNEEQVMEIVRSYTLNYANNPKPSDVGYFKDSKDEVILAACRFNLNPEAFKILTSSFLFHSSPLKTIESLLHEISAFKSGDFSDKIVFLQENVNLIKSDPVFIDMLYINSLFS